MAAGVDIVETTDIQSIYSPEFPNAYIIQNESTEQSKSAANTQTVSATVFLEEEYGFDDSRNPITISSRLLSESEVFEVGLENFRDMEGARRDAVSNNAEYGMSDLTELPLLVMCDSVPNAGRVWEFYDFWQVPIMGSYAPTHITNIDLNVTLSKSNRGNDKAEAVLKYIHTYESTKGSISITANSSGVGGGLVLNNVSKQWSIVCTITGIPC